MEIWSLLEGPFIDVALGSILAYSAFLMLGEYRKLFMSNPKSAISIEALMLAVTSTGGPGYVAAFLLVGATLCFLLAAYTLFFDFSSYFGVIS
jgi:hypothetical protein